MPSLSRRRSLLALLAVGAALVGCRDSSGPNGFARLQLPASYRLVALDGVPLPGTVRTAWGEERSVLDDSLALREDQSYWHRTRFRNTSGQRSLFDPGSFEYEDGTNRLLVITHDLMLTGVGTPLPDGGIEFQTARNSAYGVHTFRFERIR